MGKFRNKLKGIFGLPRPRPGVKLKVKKNPSEAEASLVSGVFVCNPALAKYVNSLERKNFRLEKEVVRLYSILNCNLEAKGRAVFKRVTPCACVEAEINHRDSVIETLRKENGILRKKKLLKKSKR